MDEEEFYTDSEGETMRFELSPEMRLIYGDDEVYFELEENE